MESIEKPIPQDPHEWMKLFDRYTDLLDYVRSNEPVVTLNIFMLYEDLKTMYIKYINYKQNRDHEKAERLKIYISDNARALIDITGINDFKKFILTDKTKEDLTKMRELDPNQVELFF